MSRTRPYVAADEEMFCVQAADGRIIEFSLSGDPKGVPFVYFPGSPGSAKGPLPGDLPPGVLLVTINRPGYGRSTARPGRRVIDVVPDVVKVMDSLGHKRFGVLGRSGGGKYALACAALLPDRVMVAATISSPAPPVGAWLSNITDDNKKLLTSTLAELLEAYGERKKELCEDKFALLSRLLPDLHRSDVEFLLDDYWKEAIAIGHLDAMSPHPYGWVEDTLNAADWGFDPRDIYCPELHIQGRDDSFVSSRHAIDYYGRHLQLPVIRLDPYPTQMSDPTWFRDKLLESIDRACMTMSEGWQGMARNGRICAWRSFPDLRDLDVSNRRHAAISRTF